MFTILKKSSPDKSASLRRSSSLRSTGNDTSTGTVTNKFRYFQDTLENLNQIYGDIKNNSMTIDKSIYTAAQDKYKCLHDQIKQGRIPKPEEKKAIII